MSDKTTLKNIITAGVFLGTLSVLGEGAAAVVGTHVMTFSNGKNCNSINGSCTTGAIPGSMNSAFGQYYLEDGIQFSDLGFGKAPGQALPALGGSPSFSLSHVHGAANNGDYFVRLDADAGGGFFRMQDGSEFGVNGLDVASMKLQLDNGKTTNVVFRGYTSPDFSTWDEVILGSTNGGLTPVSADGSFTVSSGSNGPRINLKDVASFQNVYLVEYWYDLFGRGNDPAQSPDGSFALNVNFGIDNLTLTPPATSPVPLPGAVWLFGSGLLGLFGLGGRRRLPVLG